METAFITGNASKEDIMKDAETLSLDMNLVSELVEQEETDDEEDDDDELFAMQRMCSSQDGGIDYAICLEGSLKLKEISYIHSEEYAAGMI